MNIFEVVIKMALRGEDQFYFHLSSDGSMDIYPENKSSHFKIGLKQPIDVTEDDWEVGLVSINYPYSWTNVGPSARTFFKYFIDYNEGWKEVHFPDWLCENIEDLVEYLKTKLRQTKPENEKIFIKLDELKRFKMSSLSPTFDFGMSESLLRLLGLDSHPLAKHFSIKAFDRRQKYRDFLSKVWNKEHAFNFGDHNLKKRAREIKGLEEFGTFIQPYVDLEILDEIVKKYITSEIKPGDQELGDVILYKMVQDELDKLKGQTSTEVLDDKIVYMVKGFGLIMYNLKKLLYEKEFPKTIKSVTPGNINPVQRMYIYLNIIQPIDFNDGAVRLLKMINTHGSPFVTTHEEFTHPTYLPLQKRKILMIEVFILNDQGLPISFQTGTVMLTLHFKKISMFGHSLPYFIKY